MGFVVHPLKKNFEIMYSESLAKVRAQTAKG